jgi:hypothetical protein
VNPWLPPPWAIPLYLFEGTVAGVVFFELWLLWPLMKDSLAERLGKKPAAPKAPPVGR